MDRRQQKTKAAIFNAFETLLTRKNYSSITVQEIIDEANVGRTTFYAHFETKDSLLQQMCDDLFDHVFADRPGAETTHDFSLSEGDMRTIVTHILYHLGENGKSLSRLLTGESSEVFMQCFRKYLDQLIRNFLLSEVRHENRQVSREFLQNHVTGSFVNMVQWWFATGMKQTPEELAASYMAVIEPIL